MKQHRLLFCLGLGLSLTAVQPAAAQVTTEADRSVTVNLGAIDGGGPPVYWGQTPPPGGLLFPGRRTPRSTLYVTPPAGSVPQLRLPEPAPSQSAFTPPAPAPKPAPGPKAADAPPSPPAAPKSAPERPAIAEAPPPKPAPLPKVLAPVRETKPEDKTAETAVPNAPPPPPKPKQAPEAAPTPLPKDGNAGIAALPGKDEAVISIQFQESASKLPNAMKAPLKKLTDKMKDDQNVRLQLRAFAGGPTLKPNRARRLSLSRALSVRSYLMENGIRSTRIDVRALGNKSDNGLANKVDIYLTDR